MADIVDKPTRSRMMAGIKNKNTQPELVLRKALHGLGFRYRLHVSGLPGRPDLVFPKYMAAIQVQGCFWHRHKGCCYCSNPASNRAFWSAKFKRTVERDKRNLLRLLDDGWRVAVIWECVLREGENDSFTKELSNWLRGTNDFIELPRAKRL
jgi:DNA mismatch endonuclease (patch repair protein)